VKQELMNGTPPGSIHACHPSGWIQSEIFPQWYLHFVKHTKSTKEDPVLVLHGHYSHTRNLEVITLPRENRVDTISLQPLTAATKCNPWIKLSWGPLTTFYCQEIENWLRSHSGRVVIVYQIGEIFGNAYTRVATGEIAPNDFRVTGLFPCDMNTFRPYDFPLSSEDKDAAPANHPALVNTNYRPSFSSANFSPFTSAEAL
jgi:hypothetical protein